MVAAINSGNEASSRFHERLGFVEVDRMPALGAKFGRWLDLVLLQHRRDDSYTRRLPIAEDGSISLVADAWAFRGRFD